MQKILLFLLCLIVASFALSKKAELNYIVTSKAGNITQEEFDLSVNRYLKQISRLAPGKTLSKENIQDIKNTTLNDMILRDIFCLLGKDENVKVLDSDVRERFLIVCTGIFNDNEKNFIKAIEEDGWTEKDYLDNLRKIIIAERVRQKYMGTYSVVEDSVSIYYNKNKKEFEVEEINISHILINVPDNDVPERGLKTVRTELIEKGVVSNKLDSAVKKEITLRKEKLETILDSLRSGLGPNFSEFAKKYSDDSSGKTGGSLGVVAKGVMVKSFEIAAFKLKNGEISNLVRTEFGFHIVKANSDVIKRIKKFDEVKEQIKLKIRAKHEASKIDKLKKDWNVTIFGDM